MNFGRFCLIASLSTMLALSTGQVTLADNGNSGINFSNCQITSSAAGWNTVGFPIEQRFNGTGIPTLPREGKIKAFIIPVDFPNYPGKTDVKEYVKFFTTPMSDFYNWVSYGKVNFEFSTTTSYVRLPRNAESYSIGNWNSGDYLSYYLDGINAASSTYNLSGYDVVYVIASPETSRDAITPGPAFIAQVVAQNGVIIPRGSATGGMEMNERPFRWITHETGHLFGFNDLYNIKSGVNRLNDIHDNFGHWDIMSMNWETFALELNAWFRLQAGWLSGENAYCNKSESISLQEVRLTKLSSTTGKRAFVLRTGEESAIVAEYRTLTKYDTLNNKSANQGVLVYEVSGNIPTDQAPVKILRKNAMLVDRPLSDAGLKVGELIEHKDFVISVTRMDKESATLLIGKNSDIGSIKSRTLEAKTEATEKTQNQAEAATKATVAKKKTIICIKSKTVRKVTAEKPKCPRGFNLATR